MILQSAPSKTLLDRCAGGMTMDCMRVAAGMAYCLVSLFCTATGNACNIQDSSPRTVIMTAFEPEWQALRDAIRGRHDLRDSRAGVVMGEIGGRKIVAVMSGISMVNAAMKAQMAVDCFKAERIIFSGIAGGANPGLAIGDVVIPAQWSEYLESVYARRSGGTYTLPAFLPSALGLNFGMIFPESVQIVGAGGVLENRQWFAVDAELLAAARTVAASTVLRDCDPGSGRCLGRKPRIVVGGNGVSGQAFVDNAEFRDWVRSTFQADAIDMESAAVAHVAYTNHVPFLAIRSLSDLAGGDADENRMKTFQSLAASNSVKVVRALIQALP
jgi:adenosylhomocysteine nucleosidase